MALSYLQQIDQIIDQAQKEKRELTKVEIATIAKINKKIDVKAAKDAEKKSKVKVKFIKSPAALFLLAHRPGQFGEFKKDLADELIAAGVAVESK